MTLGRLYSKLREEDLVNCSKELVFILRWKSIEELYKEERQDLCFKEINLTLLLRINYERAKAEAERPLGD